ncbi:MAG: large conductance mechanosensitive channel protein MscL, partial [candidate division KSB1 bacterium]|nr:large conductance mechanosensitive channel protein MscL [candidate division KSB1 bacterium]
GIIIGAAFGSIVSSLVNDVIMPPVGLLTGGIDFSNLAVTLQREPVVAIKYGVFINAVINFLIIAFAMFMIVRAMNRLKKKAEAASAAPTTRECPECLMPIPLKARRCGHCTAVVA